MPIMKPRRPSLELIVMSYLNLRMEFTMEEKERLYSIKTGYEGEVLFDTYYEGMPDNWLVLNDLWLRNKGSNFQIDSLLILPRVVYIFDVKNFKEVYELIKGYFYKNGKQTRTNPLTQLENCTTAFRYFANQLGSSLPIVSNLVFVNSEFTLYGVTSEDPIILPTQIKPFFEKLKRQELNASGGTKHAPTKATQDQLYLANQISSLHLAESPYTNIPKYTFQSLRTGMICSCCNSFLAPPERKRIYIVCHECGNKESIESCILRSIEEFCVLFPDEKITTDNIKQWCKIIHCDRRIRRILHDNFQKIGTNRFTYYEGKIQI